LAWFFPVWLGFCPVWLGFFWFFSVWVWFGSVSVLGSNQFDLVFFGLTLFLSGLAWFFSVWVWFGFFSFRLIKPKPNRTGQFFQNFNRFNRVFFTVRFFRLFFSGFLGLIGFLVFLFTPIRKRFLKMKSMKDIYNVKLIDICLYKVKLMKIKLKIRLKICLLNIFVSFRPPGDTNREFSNHSSYRFFLLSNIHYSHAITSPKRVERIEFFFELCSHVKEIEHM